MVKGVPPFIREPGPQPTGKMRPGGSYFAGKMGPPLTTDILQIEGYHTHSTVEQIK